MLILVTYDVSTANAEGRRRLRQVARACIAHGVRVQNSVFECLLDAAQFKLLQAQIREIIDQSEDSVRFYELGNQFRNKVIQIGRKRPLEHEEVLMI